MYDSDVAAEIRANNAAYAQRVAEIKADASLSPEGKRAAVQREYEAAKARHDELVERNRSNVELHVAALRNRAFGTSEIGALERDSFRAALAAATGAASLKDLAAAAEIADDRVLLRAVAAAAVARGDAEVISIMAETNPALAEYAEARRSPSSKEKIVEQMELGGPHLPSDLG